MTIKSAALVAVVGFLATLPVRADPASSQNALPVGKAWHCYDAKQDIFDARLDIGKVRVNNFSLSDQDVNGVNRLYEGGVTFTFSISNREAEPVLVDTQLAAFDDGKKLLFVGRAGPQNHFVGPSTTETATGTWVIGNDDIGRVRTYCLQVQIATRATHRYGRRPD